MVDWTQILGTVFGVLGAGVSVYAAIRADISAHAAKIASLEKTVDRIEAHIWSNSK